MTAERLPALVFRGHGKCFIQVHPGQGPSGSLCSGWARPAGACWTLTHPLLPGCRGLRFIQVFLQSICDGERDENHPNLIRVNATKAYEMALKKYHGWIVQKIFQVSRPAGAEGPLGCGVRPPPHAPSLWPPLPRVCVCTSHPELRKGSPPSLWGEAGAMRGLCCAVGIFLGALWWF